MVTSVNNVEMKLKLDFILYYIIVKLAYFLHAYGEKLLEIQAKMFVFESTYIPTNKTNQNLSKMSIHFICPIFLEFNIVKTQFLVIPNKDVKYWPT